MRFAPFVIPLFGIFSHGYRHLLEMHIINIVGKEIGHVQNIMTPLRRLVSRYWTTKCRPPRLLRAFEMLIVAMGIIGAMQPVVAQELQPAIVQPTNVDYGLLLRTPNPTICIGQTLIIGTTIVSQLRVPDDENVPAPESTVLSIESVYLEASVNSDILTSTGTPSQPVRSINNLMPFEGSFEFTGVAAGRTTIQFRGEVRNFLSRYPVHEAVDVRVIPCHLQVMTNARWFQRLIGGNVTVYAILYDGEMVGDSSGVYTGTGNVVWLVYAAIPGCAQTNTLHYGTVDLRGSLADNDQIMVDMTYAPLPGSEVINCPGLGRGGGDIFANAGPLRAVVPSTGGVVTLPQRLAGAAGEITGRSFVSIVPLAD